MSGRKARAWRLTEPRGAFAGPILVAGGLDPSGRAGLLADVATVRDAGRAASAVATTLTAQGRTTFVSRPVPVALLRSQLRALAELGAPAAVKLGVVPHRAALECLRAALGSSARPWVVDPVVKSSSGGRLSSLRPADYLALADARCVLTPNAPEAAWLLGWPRPASSVEELRRAGDALLARGFGAVVLKGGHLPSGAVDLVCTPTGTTLLRGLRLARTSAHRGTGCRFASALASALAEGVDVVNAALRAKRSVRRFIAILAGKSGPS